MTEPVTLLERAIEGSRGLDPARPRAPRPRAAGLLRGWPGCEGAVPEVEPLCLPGDSTAIATGD